jgi:L-seryl-tRNA(Ser) seleniumtransferase
MIGGGSLPEESLPAALLAIPRSGALSARDIALRLRSGTPPVIARVERDEVLLDPRTVDPADDDAVIRAVLAAVAAPSRDAVDTAQAASL